MKYHHTSGGGSGSSPNRCTVTLEFISAVWSLRSWATFTIAVTVTSVLTRTAWLIVNVVPGVNSLIDHTHEPMPLGGILDGLGFAVLVMAVEPSGTASVNTNWVWVTPLELVITKV